MKRLLRAVLDKLISHDEQSRINDPDWLAEAKAFEKRIDYSFSNTALLRAAMTHLSYFRRGGENADSTSAFERMEFLGDSILGLVVAEELFMLYPDSPEGELSKLKAKIVSEKFLALKAEEIELGDCLLLSDEEDRAGGRQRKSIVSDAMESLICAIYLDADLAKARRFIKRFVLHGFEETVTRESLTNFKSILQEHTQSLYQNTPDYNIVKEAGPDHRKTFTIEVFINGEKMGVGKGASKKQAEQSAAGDACRNLNLR